MTRRIVKVWQYIVAIVLFLAMMGTLQFFPASYWFDVRSINVSNGKVGRDIHMQVDRTIVRDFHALWGATLRKWDGSGWVTICNASGTGNYRTIAKFPNPLTLDWWTWGQCKIKEPGRYHIETVWNIDGLGLMPDKQIGVMSNVFDVE